MNTSEVLALFPTSAEVVFRHIDSLPTSKKKTAKSLLESLIKLAYVLYAVDEHGSAAIIADSISQIPFENKYDYWTWVEGALVLQGTLADERGDTKKVQHALEVAVAALNTGSELQIEVKSAVHRRVLDGRMLNDGFDRAGNVATEFDMRIDYLMALLKIRFFGGSEVWTLSAIDDAAATAVQEINKLVGNIGLYKLPPYE